MANYGRGWDDGYGSQSKEAADAAYERSEAEYWQQVNAARARRQAAKEEAAKLEKEEGK